MRNKRMEEKIQNGEALDLSSNEREGRYYVLKEVVDGMDYCDAVRECWIWSIGRRNSDGKILADTTGVFYQNPDFECLWLR
jgi:hypothetical protein